MNMRGINKFLIALGVIALLLGVLVYIIMLSGGVSGEEMDMAYGVSEGLGMHAYLQGYERLWLVLGHYRLALLLGGMLAFSQLPPAHALIVVGKLTARRPQ